MTACLGSEAELLIAPDAAAAVAAVVPPAGLRQGVSEGQLWPVDCFYSPSHHPRCCSRRGSRSVRVSRSPSIPLTLIQSEAAFCDEIFKFPRSFHDSDEDLCRRFL